MAERYISREWMLKTLEEYKNIKTWNTDVCDADTVLRVLQVIENVVNRAPDIGPRQYGNKILAAKNAALDFQLKHLKRQRQNDGENYVIAESVGNFVTMGLYQGRGQVEDQVIDWLERMVRNG